MGVQAGLICAGVVLQGAQPVTAQRRPVVRAAPLWGTERECWRNARSGRRRLRGRSGRMACGHQASGLAHRLVAGSPPVCPDRPGSGRPQLSATQMAPRLPGGNCSTGPVIAGARGAICGQVMALDVH
jgi:hypothetical protein